LEARLAEAEGRAQALEAHSAQTERDFHEKLSSAESVSAKKLRDELNQANKKAMEASGGLAKEKRERESAEGRIGEAERRAHQLQSQVAALEQSLLEAREQGKRAPPAAGGASAEVVAERDKLKQDVANMKRKLVAAENAMEAAAALKSKVTRLEAELKKHKK
jgi:predicted  nucleic acid-binding Zn-ribbon protein